MDQPFYSQGKTVNEKDGLKFIPLAHGRTWRTDEEEDERLRQKQVYEKTLRYKVTKLIEQTGKKFVFDEGLSRHKKYRFPAGSMNIVTLAKQSGYVTNNGMGLTDHSILHLAKKHGYIVITRDKGFVLMALEEKETIVYRSQDGNLIYIDGSTTIKI